VKIVWIALTNLRRLFRERSNLFFILVLPLLIILVLGLTFGSGDRRVGVVASGAGPLGAALVQRLDDAENVEVKRYASTDDVVRAVERDAVVAGVVVPAGYDAGLRAGGDATVRFLARPVQDGPQLAAVVQAVVAEQAERLRAARLAVAEGVAGFDAGLEAAELAERAVPRVEVTVTKAGEPLFEDAGGFDLVASQELLLFVFLTSMTGAAALIETRRLGLSRRMLSTPTPIGAILAGEALGRFLVALTQALLIVAGTLLLFQADWGDPLGTAALVVLFCLVGTGAGTLVGASLANDQQSTAAGLFLGLVLAALGGCMVPLEVFPQTMRTIAHVTPHAWGNDAFAELIGGDGGLRDVGRELGVLAAYAAGLLALATWRLRRALTA
jgi:ABC-2 type transport system permease protein